MMRLCGALSLLTTLNSISPLRSSATAGLDTVDVSCEVSFGDYAIRKAHLFREGHDIHWLLVFFRRKGLGVRIFDALADNGNVRII